MHSLFAFAAPFALMLPLLAESAVESGKGSLSDGLAGQCEAVAPSGKASAAPVPLNPLSALRQSSTAQQIRIEQRVVVRISPRPAAARLNMLAEMPQRDSAPRFEERGKEKCVPLGEIAGVQTGSGNRLVLFLRDQRMLSVNLEKSCRARDFYSGFYVEKSKDGRLCVSRDKLQSRTGARCEIDVMRQLVQVRS